MGRHKVTIKKIEDATRSQITFSKRRNGLIKKIHELSTLCDVDVALVAFSPSGRVSQYPSDNKKFMKTLNRYVYLPILDRDYDVDDPKFHLNKLDHITDDGDKIIVVNREIKRYEQLKAVAELELHMNENKLRCFDKSLPKHATSLTEIRWQRKFLTDMLNQVRQRKEILIQGSLMNEDPPIGYLVDVDQKNLYNHLFVDGSQPNGLLVNGSEANGMLHGSSFSNNGKSSMVLSPKKSTGLRVNNYQVQRMDMPLGSKSSFLNNQCRSQVELSQDSKLMVGSAPTVLFTGNSSTDNNYNDNDGEQNQVFYNPIGMGMHADSFIQLYKDNKKKNKNVEKYQMNILNQELDNLVGMSLQGDSLLQLEKDSKNNNTTNGGDNQMNMLHGEYYNPICTCLHGKYFHNPTGTCLHVDAFRRTYMENNNNREKTPTIVRFMSSQVYCCNPMDTSSYVNPFLLCNNNKGKEKQMDMLSQEYARSNPRPQAYATKELDIRGSQIQNYEDVSNQDVILYNNQTSPENASDDLQHVDDDIGISKVHIHINHVRCTCIRNVQNS